MRKEDLLPRAANGNVVIDRSLEIGYRTKPEKEDDGMAKSFTIYKADDDQHLVFGWASVAITVDGEELEDMQHDMIDPEDLEEAAYEYVLNFRDTGEEHLPGYRKKGRLVESCVFTPEKQKAMGIPAGTLPVAWWIGFKIDDEDTWRRVKDGTYRMFSIEGKAQREPVEKANTIAKSFEEILEKFNPYHDRLGRFTGPGGGAGGPVTFFTNQTKDPNKQHWADKAKLREQERQVKILEQKKQEAKDHAEKLATDNDATLDEFKQAVSEWKKIKNELDETKKPLNIKQTEENKPTSAPKEFKAPTSSEVKEMAKEMGNSRNDISQEDFDTMTGWDGYFQTSHSFHLNEKLRKAKDGDLSHLSEADRKLVDTLDKNMKPCTRDIKVTRMVGDSFLREQLGLKLDLDGNVDEKSLKNAAGKVTVCKAYSSTSYDIGDNVFTSRNVKLNINAPKGSKMLVSPTGKEAEILLARNTALHVKGIRKTGTTSWGEPQYEVDVEIVVD